MDPQPLLKIRKGTIFTKENCRFYSAQGTAKKRLLKEQRLALKLLPPPLPPVPESILATQTAILATQTTLFCEKRIARVRKQLEKIDAMISQELDPQKLDRLASAQSRVSEQERILSGRPLPGSRRPIKERTHPSASSAEQLTPE